MKGYRTTFDEWTQSTFSTKNKKALGVHQVTLMAIQALFSYSPGVPRLHPPTAQGTGAPFAPMSPDNLTGAVSPLLLPLLLPMGPPPLLSVIPGDYCSVPFIFFTGRKIQFLTSFSGAPLSPGPSFVLFKTKIPKKCFCFKTQHRYLQYLVFRG